MPKKTKPQEKDAYLKRLKAISNRHRLKILQLTSSEQLSITELSSQLKLSYTKCADYVTMLANYGLVKKHRRGKETHIESLTRISDEKIEFLEKKTKSAQAKSPKK